MQLPSASLPRCDRPPGWLWLLAAAVGLARLLPYLWSFAVVPPTQGRLLHLGYNPEDFLAYLAFVRQVPADHTFFFYNPFTTEPQSGRFLLLFHWVLGAVCLLTRASPALVLELSRIPLIVWFFWVLWHFLGPILPDRRTRSWACVLIAFSGGLEGAVKLFVAQLPTLLGVALATDTRHLYGWNTFAAFYNPLWIAGLTISLVALAPVLKPENTASRAGCVKFAVALALLYDVHPYSGIVVLAVWLCTLLTEALVDQRVHLRKHAALSAAALAALVPCAGLAWWQMQDPVYRSSSSGMLGPQAAAVFWYPLTLGAIGIFALRGGRRWAAAGHPYRTSFFAWVGAVVLLHSSPVLNGYHFVFHLHIPVSIVAATGLVAALDARARRSQHGRGTLLLVALLFPSCALITAETVGNIARFNLVPAAYVEVTDALASLPAGNALVPPTLGNMLPAYTSHRVWVGHWFLTPDASRKSAEYASMTTDARQLARLRTVLREQHIRYLVVPQNQGGRLMQELGPAVVRRIAAGGLDILVVQEP